MNCVRTHICGSPWKVRSSSPPSSFGSGRRISRGISPTAAEGLNVIGITEPPSSCQRTERPAPFTIEVEEERAMTAQGFAEITIDNPRSRPTLASGKRPARLLAAGAVAAILAVSSLGFSMQEERDATRPAGRSAVAEHASLTVPGEVVVVGSTYDVGQSSGWHIHPGVHSVDVLSGALTVYDTSCQPHVYAPGQTYVGGPEPHVARNEGDVPIEMMVTTTYPSMAADSVTHLPPPPNCSVA